MLLFKIKKAYERIVCLFLGHRDLWVDHWGDSGVVLMFGHMQSPTWIPSCIVIYECQRCGRLKSVYKDYDDIYEMRKDLRIQRSK